MLNLLIFTFSLLAKPILAVPPTCQQIQEMKAAITEIILDSEMLMPKAVRLGKLLKNSTFIIDVNVLF